MLEMRLKHGECCLNQSINQSINQIFIYSDHL